MSKEQKLVAIICLLYGTEADIKSHIAAITEKHCLQYGKARTLKL